MKMDLALIRWFVCLMAAVLVSACGDSDQAAQTQVVRKKLTAQADRSQPAPKAAPAHAAPADATVTAKAKPPEPVPTSPPPKPSEPPKPAEPPPPTHVAQTPAALVQPAQAPDPTVLLAKASAAPEVVAPLGSDPMPERALFISDKEVAAILNIQAPPPYSKGGKVNPFEPLLRDEGAQSSENKLTAKKRIPQSPLEKIDLGQLKLVGIVAAVSGHRALMEETSGKGYIIVKGTYIGSNSGKVVDIEIDKVVIEEEFEDAYGKTILKKREIALPKPPGEL
jgi:type IV pilus assembly protein PilP